MHTSGLVEAGWATCITITMTAAALTCPTLPVNPSLALMTLITSSDVISFWVRKG